VLGRCVEIPRDVSEVVDFVDILEELFFKKQLHSAQAGEHASITDVRVAIAAWTAIFRDVSTLKSEQADQNVP